MAPFASFADTLATIAAPVLRPVVFVPLTLGLAAAAMLLPGTNEALARCEMRGGSVTECRLIVLGR
jgi:hypothetical protein